MSRTDLGRQPGSHPGHRARRPFPEALALAAALACGSALAVPTHFDAATGTLTVGSAAPVDLNVKIEVGPAAGQARVISATLPGTAAFSGVRAVRVVAGASTDQVEFDINASQSLALAIDTGAGDAQVKIQWKVPAGATATTSSLSMSSGGGRVNTELDFEGGTTTSVFNWSTSFGGGDKLVTGKVAFLPSVATARNTVNLANLGGGSHTVALNVDSKAQVARLNFNSGFARDVSYKVGSSDATQRLESVVQLGGAFNTVEINAAAAALVTTLRGTAGNTSGATTQYGVVQTVPGTLAATVEYATLASGANVGLKFDAPASLLTLGGRLTGSVGNDGFKVESAGNTVSSLQIDAGDGQNLIEFLVGGRLVGTTAPTLRAGSGNDILTLVAAPGSIATPLLDCGAGTDEAKASVGNAIGCEIFAR
jgi:hypothetical protein